MGCAPKATAGRGMLPRTHSYLRGYLLRGEDFRPPARKTHRKPEVRSTASEGGPHPGRLQRAPPPQRLHIRGEATATKAVVSSAASCDDEKRRRAGLPLPQTTFPTPLPQSYSDAHRACSDLCCLRYAFYSQKVKTFLLNMKKFYIEKV